MKPLKKETAKQRRDRMTYNPGDLEPLGRSDVTPESALTGTLEQWDDALFKNADKFNICIVIGHGRHSRVIKSLPSFITAMDIASRFPTKPTDADERVMIYAVNPNGAYACLPHERWDHFRALWLKMHPKFQDQVFKLIEGWYCIIAGKIYGPHSLASDAATTMDAIQGD
jgi:hypothetical protein